MGSESVFLISLKIHARGPPTSSKSFILPSDPDGKFELFWSKSGSCINKLGIRWEAAKLRTLNCTTARIFIVAGQHQFQNAPTVANWTGLSFPETESGFLTTIGPLLGWINTQFAQVFVEFSGSSAVEPDLVPSDSRHIDIHSNQLPISNNVRIYFPATQSDLWTTESSLKKASDHFETLFSSEYSEAAVLNEIRNDSSNYEKDFDDSDDDEDEDESMKEIVENNKLTVKSGAPFKQVKIDAISHSTFRAFLHWIQTGQVLFAPLSSNYRLDSDPITSRRAAIDKLVKDSNLPRPVSPKSMYRLAHYYGIPTLKSLAVASIKEQLTVENVAFEVFGDSSEKYEEIRDLNVEYAVNNWNEVSESKGMEEMERLAEIGEIEISLTLMKISRKLKFVAQLQGNEGIPCPIAHGGKHVF